MDVIAIFKALGDSSRLAMLREIFKGPLCAEELCERLKLAPSTISHHAGKLVKAELLSITKEQQSVIYELSETTINLKIKDLILTESDSTVVDGRKEAYRKKVLNHFVEFGKLKTIPAQRKKRRIILEQMMSEFEEERKYSEPEVNEILKNWHDDYCYFRRELISEKLLARKKGIYWRVL